MFWKTTLMVVGFFAGVMILGGWWLWYSPWARKQNSPHLAAWTGFTDPNKEGFSKFQIDCETLIVEKLASRGLQFQDRIIQGEGEQYVYGRIPELDAEVWIHFDQADIVTPNIELRLEEWDVETPNEYYARVENFIMTLPQRD